MVQPRDVEGKFYRFKSKSELLNLGCVSSSISDRVRRHMVVVLGIVKGRKDYVEVMTVTSTRFSDSEYVPIAPVPKKGFPLQIQLQNQFHYPYGAHILFKPSYLKIDTYYEVPIQMLGQVFDNMGYPIMMRPKHHGGLAELRNHIAHRKLVRNPDEICRLMESQTIEEDF